MNEKQALDALTAYVRQQSQIIETLPPDEAMQAQMELSAYMGEQMRSLLQQGLSMAEIQEGLRAGIPQVPVSSAADIHVDAVYEDEAELDLAVQFSGIDEQSIVDFEKGKLSKDAFWNLINNSDSLLCDHLDEIGLILSEYKEENPSFTLLEAGEILADATGEALIPLQMRCQKDHDTAGQIIAEPAVYKTAKEVVEVFEKLSSIQEADFRKMFHLKKLMRSMFGKISMRNIKHKEEEIFNVIWSELQAIQKFYGVLAQDKKAIVIYLAVKE